MSGTGFFSNSVLSIVGTAAIYVIGFKNPALLKALVKNPSLISKELDAFYIGTRSANRILQYEKDHLPHNMSSLQAHQNSITTTHNAGHHLDQAA
ncbi:MAG: hypothetical protein HYY52_00160 [Candidatus Melainabacteria bacterium]|nr:hypothetical protein [Candidatus Melainabacteria bacterium]